MRYPRIRDLREDHDYTQKELADELGINSKTYSNYESGNRPIPVTLLCTLADLYGVSIDYLLGRTNEEKPYPVLKK